MSSTQEEHSIYKTSEKLSQKLNNNLHNSINDQEIADLANEIKHAVYDNVRTCLPRKIYKSIEEETMFGYSPTKWWEAFFENMLFHSRWIMAFAFFIAAFSMVALVLEIFIDVWHLGTVVYEGLHKLNHIEEQHKTNFILAILTLLDNLLIGSLVVMVLISGYENTVSRMKVGEDGPSWLGKIGISDLKTKIASSIVAISSIHLLQIFLSLDKKIEVSSNDNTMWAVIIHLVFIISAFILAKVANMHPEDAHANMDNEPCTRSDSTIHTSQESITGTSK
jgi:uncharacterized protein (TIGR00645 family)